MGGVGGGVEGFFYWDGFDLLIGVAFLAAVVAAFGDVDASPVFHFRDCPSGFSFLGFRRGEPSGREGEVAVGEVADAHVDAEDVVAMVGFWSGGRRGGNVLFTCQGVLDVGD